MDYLTREISGQRIYELALALPIETKRKMVEGMGYGVMDMVRDVEVEAAILNFAEWCLDEDGGRFFGVGDAWDRFIQAGAVGTVFSMALARARYETAKFTHDPDKQ